MDKPALYSKQGRYRRASVADRTSADGVVFDSKAELRRWEELRLLQRAGKISELQRQRKIPLAVNGRPITIRSARYPNGRACVYTLDFSYDDENGKPVYEEFKGLDTAESRLRRAVVEALLGIEITVTGAAAVNTPGKPA
jgi:hypothetical protein